MTVKLICQDWRMYQALHLQSTWTYQNVHITLTEKSIAIHFGFECIWFNVISGFSVGKLKFKLCIRDIPPKIDFDFLKSINNTLYATYEYFVAFFFLLSTTLLLHSEVTECHHCGRKRMKKAKMKQKFHNVI